MIDELIMAFLFLLPGGFLIISIVMSSRKYIHDQVFYSTLSILSMLVLVAVYIGDKLK